LAVVVAVLNGDGVVHVVLDVNGYFEPSQD